MKKHYCTYFDRNYLIKGIALIESLKAHEKNPFELFIVCLDEYTRIILNKMSYSFITLIPLHEIEYQDTDLIAARQNRSLLEYYWTLTPTVILRILERNSSVHQLIYIDADIFFYSSPDPIWDEFDDHSVMIHEHRFSPEQKYLERNGKYNVGLLCFKKDTNAMAALNWWRNRCNEWCFFRLENGKFGDQLYLDQFPIRFKNVKILEHIGAGVAPWNHIQYEFYIDNEEKRWVNNVALVFYHFHSLEMVSPEIIIPSKFFPVTPFTEDIINVCFEPYANALYQGFQKIKSIHTDFASGFTKKDMIKGKQLFLAHQSVQSHIKINNISYNIKSLGHEWLLYFSSTLRNNTKHNKQIIIDHLIDEAENEHQKGNISNAIHLLLDIIKQYPDHPIALNDLAVIHLNIGEMDLAKTYFQMAYQISPDNKTIVTNLAQILIKTGQKDKANTIISKYLSRKPDDTETQQFFHENIYRQSL